MAVIRLASDGAPRWVGVDFGRGDVTTEAEIEVLPGGAIRVVDLRQWPPARPDRGACDEEKDFT